MNIRIHSKIIKKLKLCFIILVYFLFANISTAYAVASPSIASPSDLSSGLSSTESEEIEGFDDIKEMLSQIFELSSERGTDDLSDPIKLMYSLLGRVLNYYNDFVSESLYKLLIGLALIRLMAYFCLKTYEESSIGGDIKLNSATMIRKYMVLIMGLLLIANLSGIIYFVIGFFRFILKLAIGVTDANFLGEPDEIENVLNADRVAYEILKANGVIKSDTLLDEVIVRSKEAAVRATYMIPWVFSWISKMALLVVIFINSINLLVHSIFYVVSVGDFFSGFRESRFIEYTRTIIALALEETVIIIVLYISNMLLNPYLRELLKDGVTSHGISFLTLAMIFTGVQMAKVFAIILSSKIAKKIMGVS